jgi:hypothetical protein
MNWMFILMWILNFGISIWNAYACGHAWVETKYVGGWRRFMVWMGAIMSATGFTWCYLFLLALVAQNFEWITEQQFGIAVVLGWIVLTPGLLFSGLMITIDSWAIAFRNGGIANYGIAAYNTFAQLHNTYSAIRNMGAAFNIVGRYFKDSDTGESDRGGKGKLAIILLVVAALLLGVLTTALIIWRVAASTSLPSWSDIEQNRRSQAGGGPR